MSKIIYTDKEDSIINPLPEINKVVADNMNEIKRSVNDLYDDVGVVIYQDTVNTVSNKQSLTAGIENIITIVDADPDRAQAPISIGESELFLDNKIRPFKNGDSYIIRIDFEAEISNPLAYFDIKVDIAGAIGLILRKAEVFPKGSNTPQPFSTPSYIYVRETFFINGGIIKITPSHSMLIWNKAISIHRIYAGR
jgi:hypothetical protein